MTCPGWRVDYIDLDFPNDPGSDCSLPTGHLGGCRTDDGYPFEPMNHEEVQHGSSNDR